MTTTKLQAKRICSEIVLSDKVQRISDMKWAGDKHKTYTGFCQFCLNPLKYAYRVFTPDGKVYEYSLGSKEADRAQKQIETNTVKDGVKIFALAACEVMCDEKIYYYGISHYKQRAKDWAAKKEEDSFKSIKTMKESEGFEVQSGF